MNVFVVVTTDGELKPYIARCTSDAIDQHCAATLVGAVIAGVFVYGKQQIVVDALTQAELVTT